MDVVVIGGGIAGAATAFFLAEKGLTVAVCEKGRFGGEQSSRNWGWVRQMGRDRAELPLAIASLNIWRELEPRWGIRAGFRQTGIVYTFRTGENDEGLSDWAEAANDYQLPLRRLTRPQLQELMPGIAPTFDTAFHTSNDGRAEPSMAVPALARAAQDRGAVLLEDCAVRGIETEAGRLSAVVTERGVIRCQAAVVAAGLWSRLFLGNLGIDFPQLKILGTAMRVETDAALPAMPVGGSDFAFRRREDGGYTISRRNASLVQIIPDSFRLLPDFLPGLKTSWRELRLRVGPAIRHRTDHAAALGERRANPFRAVPHAGSGPEGAAESRRAGQYHPRLSGLRGGAADPPMGRADRCHARRGAGDRQRRRHPGAVHLVGIFRPRFRDRTRRRAADRGSRWRATVPSSTSRLSA